MWILGPFKKAREKRCREVALLRQLDECILTLWRNPHNTGLNLEQIDVVAGYPILSARITQQFRLIVVLWRGDDLGLLYFDNHDEAYNWVAHNRSRLPSMLSRVEEVPRGQSWPVVPFPSACKDDPVSVPSEEAYREMLAGGIEKYLAYLDEEQARLAELPTRSLLLIKGAAGTGKTAVAVHRLAAILRQPDLFNPRPVLYLCYNQTLAKAVAQLLEYLSGSACSSTVEVTTIHSWCMRYLAITSQQMKDCESRCEQLFYRHCLKGVSAEVRAEMAQHQVFPPQWVDEIIRVIKGCGINSLSEYLDFNRAGRGFTLKRREREAIWLAYQAFWQAQQETGQYQWADLPLMCLRAIESDERFQPYRAVVVDEGQDFTLAMARLAMRLAGGGAGGLTFLADPAQDIYGGDLPRVQRELLRQRASLRWLRRNYRNSSEVYTLARKLIESSLDPDDPLLQVQPPDRHSSRPTLIVAADAEEEVNTVCLKVQADLATFFPQQIALLCPTKSGLPSFEHRLRALGVPITKISRPTQLRLSEPTVKLMTVASAKGLDFPCVYLVRVDRAAFGGPRKAELPSSRKSLYTALARAGQRLTVSTVFSQHHPLLEELDQGQCQIEGSCGPSFTNLFGYQGAS